MEEEILPLIKSVVQAWIKAAKVLQLDADATTPSYHSNGLKLIRYFIFNSESAIIMQAKYIEEGT